MVKPLHQRLITYTVYFGSGFIAIASLIDAINNALTIINPLTTIIGTVFILFFWIAAEIIMRKKAFKWITNDYSGYVRIKSLGIKPRLALIGAIVFLWVPRAIYHDLDVLTINNRIRPAQPREILILVADYLNQSRQRYYDIAGSIELAVNDGLSSCDAKSLLVHDIRIERLNQSFNRNQLKVVKALGKSLRATIVIWGYYDDGGIFPYFTIIPEQFINMSGKMFSSPQFLSIQPNFDNFLNPYSKVGFYVHHDVPQKITHLTEFTLGYFLTSFGDLCGAKSYLQAAINAASGIDQDEIQNTLEASYSLLITNYYFSLIFNTLDKRFYPEAITALDKAIELNPDSSYYCLRGYLLYLQDSQYDNSLKDLNTCIDKLSSGNSYGNKELYKSVPFSFYIDINTALYYRAQVYSFTGDYGKAIDDLNRSLLEDPQNADGFFLRASIFNNQSQYDNAINDLLHIIEIRPNFMKAYWTIGHLYAEKGLSDLDNSIQNNPPQSTNYLLRGLAYYEMGKYENAINDFNYLIKLKPENAYAYYFRGLCQSLLQNKIQAIGSYSEAIRIVSDNEFFYYDRGVDYLAIGDWNNAITDLSISVEKGYGSEYIPFALIYRGMAYKNLEENEKALADYEKAKTYTLNDYWRNFVDNEINGLKKPGTK